MTRAAAAKGLGVAVIAACWLSAGTAPLSDAIAGVTAPADFARDYVSARARLEDGRGHPLDGPAANDRAEAWGAPRVVLLDGPYYLHPPPAALVVLPLAALPWRLAAGGVAALSLMALVWLAHSLLALSASAANGRRAGKGHSRTKVTWLALLLLSWPPTLHCLEKGQWSIALAALMAAGTHALEERRPGRAGTFFGVAGALKATPLVLVGMLLSRERRAAAAMARTVVVLALLALAVDGAAAYRAFVVNAPRNVRAWSTWVANTASLEGVLARSLQSGPFSRPVVLAPGAAPTIFSLTALALLAGVGLVGWRRDREPAPAVRDVAADGAVPGGTRARDARGRWERARSLWSAAWLTLPVLLNPLGWTHVVLMLLPSVALAMRDGGRGCRASVLVILAVLSIPRQRLLVWAGPVPVGPGRGLLLGVHAFAALALYGVLLGACIAADRGRRDLPLAG